MCDAIFGSGLSFCNKRGSQMLRTETLRPDLADERPQIRLAQRIRQRFVVAAMFAVDQLAAATGILLSALAIDSWLPGTSPDVGAVAGLGDPATGTVVVATAEQVRTTVLHDVASTASTPVNAVLIPAIESSTSVLQASIADLPILLALFAAVMAYGSLYRPRSWELDEVRSIALASAVLTAITAVLVTRTASAPIELMLLLVWPLVAFMVIGGRMAVRALPGIGWMMARHVVLVGDGLTAEQLENQMRSNRSGSVSVVAKRPLNALLEWSPDEIRQDLDNVADIHGLSKSQIELVIAPAARDWESARSVLGPLEAMRQSAELVLPYDGLAREGLDLCQPVGSDIVLARVSAPRRHIVERVIKHIFDFMVASLLLAVLAVPLLIVALLVRADGGPALFAQNRVGGDGKVFRLFKFRTMHVDAERKLQEILGSDPAAQAEWDMHQKLDNDPRITWIGRFLRRTSLDELPQLLNVLIGEMSLVGPRPIVAGDPERYPSDADYAQGSDFRYYALFRPGITGLWQVSGRNATTYRERVRLDRWYAMNWSIWLDFVIMFKTVKALIDRTGR